GKTIQTVHGVVESRYKIDEVLVCSLISSRQGTAKLKQLDLTLCGFSLHEDIDDGGLFFQI
ncbi:MAG: hypothetical protein D6712_18440, partial [Chloroflexi bacterium]